MATHTNLNSLFTAIADAIRTKTGKTGKIVADTFPNEIAEIVTLPDTEQATPSITVSSAGLITASATQTAGYVAAGTKSATKQLTVQAAKTVTPTTSNQTAVASGRYTTGAVTVKGDSNLKAANIKKGVSIFGVTGTDVGEPVLLWTNASPNSSFAPQDISVTSGYSAYLVEILYYINYPTSGTFKGKYISFVKAQSTEQSLLSGYVAINGAVARPMAVGRILKSSTSNKLSFGDGYDAASGYSSADNTRAIPTRIWGIKWTLS